MDTVSYNLEKMENISAAIIQSEVVVISFFLMCRICYEIVNYKFRKPEEKTDYVNQSRNFEDHYEDGR